MGEIAEMMLTGVMCAGCGEFLGGEDDDSEESGFPEYCSEQCARDHGAGDLFDEPDMTPRSTPRGERTHECPQCHRKFRGEVGLLTHVKAKHPKARAKKGGKADKPLSAATMKEVREGLLEITKLSGPDAPDDMGLNEALDEAFRIARTLLDKLGAA